MEILRRQETKPGVPGGSVVENSPASARDTVSIPGLARSHVLRATSQRAVMTEPTRQPTSCDYRSPEPQGRCAATREARASTATRE